MPGNATLTMVTSIATNIMETDVMIRMCQARAPDLGGLVSDPRGADGTGLGLCRQATAPYPRAMIRS